MNRRRRVLIVTALAAVGTVLVATSAGAHVEITPGSAPKGTTTILSFRVPNEKDTASTVALEIDLPTDHPIPSVLVQQKPGWTFTVETTKLPKPVKTENGEVTEAVTKITWTGGRIDPGAFDLFSIFAGPLPKNTGKLEFKALQTYSDGDVVRWIEENVKGAPEPEHPAPVLKLTRAKKAS